MRAAVFGTSGALIGVLVWMGAAQLTGYELRWMSWVLGGAVGAAVHIGSSDRPASYGSGALAVVITAVAILVGKYLAVAWVVESRTGPLDFLFFGLAMVTAFAVAAGRKSQAEIDAEYESAIKLAMYRMMMVDGSVDDQEVATITDIYRQVTHRTLSTEAVRAEARAAVESGLDLLAPLVELSPYLSDQGVETVVKAAVLVAVADGEIRDTERALLEEIAQGVGMGQEQFQRLLGDLQV